MQKYYTAEDQAGAWKEKKFEFKMQDKCDEILKSSFNSKVVWRPSSTDMKNPYSYLDKHHGIDSYVHLEMGGVITVQEKVLRSSKQKYNHLTWEYLNEGDLEPSQATFKEKGEWFKGMANILLFGYANEAETTIERWYLIDITRLKLYLAQNYKNIMGVAVLNYNPPPAKASFLCFDWNFIEQHCKECI
ncbi:MAG: hypothetical protein ACOC2U_01070, partial [bacterium]